MTHGATQWVQVNVGQVARIDTYLVIKPIARRSYSTGVNIIVDIYRSRTGTWIGGRTYLSIADRVQSLVLLNQYSKPGIAGLGIRCQVPEG
jgi:hypothetical protein